MRNVLALILQIQRTSLIRLNGPAQASMKDNMTRLAIALLCLSMLIAACRPTGLDALTNGDDPLIEPAYETHLVAYGNALNQLDQDLLSDFDLIILGEQAFEQLESRHRHGALLYFNPWGKSTHSDSLRTWPIYQPAPGELGEVDVVMHDGVHCYRFDDAHVTRFLGWIEAYLDEMGGEVAGVFIDDFSYDRNWWVGEAEDRDLVWGPADGGPGWREEPYEWNRGRIHAIEEGARSLVRQYCGDDGILVINGIARNFEDVRRFAENVGAPASEAWDRLETPGVDDLRYVRPGDLLQVNGVGATGLWGDWCTTVAGEGETNLRRAITLAQARGASVGLAYGVEPERGGSRYSLVMPPGGDGQEWPDYFPGSQ